MSAGCIGVKKTTYPDSMLYWQDDIFASIPEWKGLCNKVLFEGKYYMIQTVHGFDHGPTVFPQVIVMVKGGKHTVTQFLQQVARITGRDDTDPPKSRFAIDTIEIPSDTPVPTIGVYHR
jgi:hypothetical protein